MSWLLSALAIAVVVLARKLSRRAALEVSTEWKQAHLLNYEQ